VDFNLVSIVWVVVVAVAVVVVVGMGSYDCFTPFVDALFFPSFLSWWLRLRLGWFRLVPSSWMVSFLILVAFAVAEVAGTTIFDDGNDDNDDDNDDDDNDDDDAVVVDPTKNRTRNCCITNTNANPTASENRTLYLRRCVVIVIVVVVEMVVAVPVRLENFLTILWSGLDADDIYGGVGKGGENSVVLFNDGTVMDGDVVLILPDHGGGGCCCCCCSGWCPDSPSISSVLLFLVITVVLRSRVVRGLQSSSG
jgi:hypothetical protein